MKNRVIAMLLAVVMLLGMFPSNVFAIELDENGNVIFQQVGNDSVSASLLDGADDPYEQGVTYEDDDIVRVSIFLDESATIDQGFSTIDIAENDQAMDYREELQQRQDGIVKEIEALLGEDMDVQWNLTLVANVISANVKFGQIQKIAQVKGVKKVVLETQYSVPQTADTEPDEVVPAMVGSSGMTGAGMAWESGYTGAGMRIAIIDTGLDTDHQSFASAPFLYALEQNAAAAGKSYEEYVASLDLLDKEELADKIGKLHVMEKNKATTVDNTYHTDKIPFAFNYVDGLYDYVTHDHDDATDHGSHVAGIAAANRYIEKNGQMVDALETVKVSGNAPDAQIIVMKVFGKIGGAYTSDFMAAIEDAIILGCDAINLSLGTQAAGFSDAGDYEQVMRSLEQSDTVVAMAAGNEGYGAEHGVNSHFLDNGYLYADDVLGSTIGSPGSYTNSMTVASADNAKVTMNGFFMIGDYAPEYSETLYNSMKAFASLDNSEELTGTEYEYVFLDGIGKESEYDFIDVTGKIVICSRGELAFYEKANIAVSKGAVATIIYNNVSGTIGMDLTDYKQEAPAISVTKDVGDRIRALSEQKMDADNNVYYTGKMTVVGGQQVIGNGNYYYSMSYFSSWGTTGDMALKPEITAPGGLIYSVQGSAAATDRYKLNSGTSMASPQVAGIAAIGSQFIQTNQWQQTTGFSIRQLGQSLLMSTAVPMKDKNGNYYPLVQQGAGLANANGIVGADSFIMMGSDATPSWQDGKVKVELGDDPDRTGIYEFTFTIYNMSGEEKTFNLSADVFTFDVTQKATNPEGTATAYYALQSTKPISSNVHFDSGAQVKVVAGGSSQVKVKIELAEEGKQWLETYFQKGTYIQAYVFAEPLGDSEGVKSTTHSIPVLAFYGNWTDPSMYEGGSVYNGDVINNYSTPNTTDYSRYPYAITWDTTDQPNFRYNLLYVENNGGAQYNWSSLYALGGNPLVKDPYYMPERDAVASSVSIRYWSYALWRDTALTGTVIENLTSGETYYKQESTANLISTYYDKNNVAWQYGKNTYYVNQNLPQVNDGDILQFTLFSLPEYYLDGNMGQDSHWGDGAELQIRLNVDATKPQVSGITYDSSGALSVTASDNNYVSAVVLYTADGKQVVSYTGSKVEIGKGEYAAYTVDTASFGATEYLLQVYDYAMNACTYYIEIDEDAIIYSGALLAYDLDSGNWVQLDKYNEKMGAITEQTKTYTAAVSVGDTIYTIAYGTELQRLSVSDPADYQFVGDTGYTLVDLAYNPADDYLYGVTDNNKLIRVNRSTGKGTLMGTVPVETNTLACDETGTFYCNQYGTGRIYSFTLNAIRSGDLRYDFNGDRSLNEADSQTLMDYLTGKTATIQKAENADIDGDGDVDTYDVYRLFALLPERVNLIAELPANSQYLQSMEIDPNSGALYWASYSTEMVGETEVSFSVLYGIDVESGTYARYGDHVDQLSCLVVLDKDVGNIYGPLGGVTKLTDADADKRSQYENAVAQPGSIAVTCGVESSPEWKLLAEQEDDGLISVDLTAQNRAYNGLYVITFDPSIMTLVGVDSTGDITSWADQNGTLTFAFAGNPAVAEGRTVATLTFATESCDASAAVAHKEENNYRPNAQNVVDAGAHTWGDWTRKDVPTCIQEGLGERICTKCGDVQTQTLPVDPTAHDWGQWQVFAGPDINYPGAQTQTCTICDQTRKQWVVDAENNQPILEDVDSWFNYLWVGQICIDSARITGASVNNVKKIVTIDGSVRYMVELSDKTALDDLVNVKLTATSMTGSGFGQAIRKNPGEDIGWQDHELDYTVQLDGGWGQMTAYSYVNSTDYTEFHIYFHIGEGGKAYSDPTYIATNDTGVTYDKFVKQIGIWGAGVDKFHWDMVKDENGNKHFTGYIWLSQGTDPNAELDIEFIRERTPEIYLNFDTSTENIAASGTTVKLENGKATLKFLSTPNLPYNPSCVDRYYTIYIRTEINNAPETKDTHGTDRMMVGETFELDLSTVFQDANGDKLSYAVSINGGEPVNADKDFHYVPTEAGTVTLEFTAFDGFFSSGSYTVTLTVLDEYLAGDANDDGVVDAKDVTALRRYLAGWDITIQAASADVNGDGSVDAKDVTVLRRQLAGM